MCIKAGKDELESVKNLMSMALKAVVADALHADLDDIVDEARLVEDLRMGSTESEALRDLLADTFDGIEVDLGQTPTVAALLDRSETGAYPPPARNSHTARSTLISSASTASWYRRIHGPTNMRDSRSSCSISNVIGPPSSTKPLSMKSRSARARS